MCNEKADAIAKVAATGDTSDYEECEKYESPSNNRLTQYWPYKTQWNRSLVTDQWAAAHVD